VETTVRRSYSPGIQSVGEYVGDVVEAALGAAVVSTLGVSVGERVGNADIGASDGGLVIVG
jgi:hypothetical protein